MIRQELLAIGLISLSLGCANTYHKAYDGPELPDDALSFVHAASAPSGVFTDLHTWLINPETGKKIPSGSSFDQGHQWLMVKPPTTCVIVRSEASTCINPFAGQCTANPRTQRDQELCFEVEAGHRYDVQTQARGNPDCYGGFEVTGYRVLELESQETVNLTEVSRHCWNYVGHRISEWARHFSWRDGNWIQRSMWSSVNEDMLKRWKRSTDYHRWWEENKWGFDSEFSDYITSAVTDLGL